jgi:hypothetical protein
MLIEYRSAEGEVVAYRPLTWWHSLWAQSRTAVPLTYLGYGPHPKQNHF